MGESGGGYTRNHGVNVGGKHVNIGNGTHVRSRSSGCNIFSCCILTVVLVVFVLVMVFVGPSFSQTYTLTQCEQVVACPSGALKEGHGIEVRPGRAQSPLIATLVPELPLVSAPGRNVTRVEHGSEWMIKDRFEYDSFHLVKGSRIGWNVQAQFAFTFYLLRGRENYENFRDGKDFKYVKHESNVAYTVGEYTVQRTDQFFAVVYAEWFATQFNYRVYEVAHTRYVVEDTALEQTTERHTFAVNRSMLPGACVVVEFPCKAEWPYSDSVTATVAYELDNHTLVVVCAVFIALVGVAIVVSIVVCLCCACRESKGDSGTVYQQVPSSSAQPAPYPAGNQPPYAPQPGYAPPPYAQPGYPPAY